VDEPTGRDFAPPLALGFDVGGVVAHRLEATGTALELVINDRWGGRAVTALAERVVAYTVGRAALGADRGFHPTDSLPSTSWRVKHLTHQTSCCQIFDPQATCPLPPCGVTPPTPCIPSPPSDWCLSGDSIGASFPPCVVVGRPVAASAAAAASSCCCWSSFPWLSWTASGVMLNPSCLSISTAIGACGPTRSFPVKANDVLGSCGDGGGG